MVFKNEQTEFLLTRKINSTRRKSITAQQHSARMCQDIRIIMVGKTGVGKSATGNTILGIKDAFKSEARATSITKHCSSRSAMINGKSVLVVDTPGLYDTNLSNEEVIKEVMNCIKLAAPGPHVFLLTLAIGRFTEEEKNTVELIQQMFGSDAHKYMMVLFTRADDLEDRTIEDYIKEAPKIKELISTCSGRYHTLNNKEKSDHAQVMLMREFEALIKCNQNSYYNYHMFTMANELKEFKKSEKEKDEIIAELKKEIEEKAAATHCSIL